MSTRAEQVARDIRDPSFPAVDMTELAALLDRLARIESETLPAALDPIAARANEWTRRCVADLGIPEARAELLVAVADRAALVEALRVESIRSSEIIDERIAEAEKWHAKWKHTKVELDVERTEVERLHAVQANLTERLRMSQSEALKSNRIHWLGNKVKALPRWDFSAAQMEMVEGVSSGNFLRASDVIHLLDEQPDGPLAVRRYATLAEQVKAENSYGAAGSRPNRSLGGPCELAFGITGCMFCKRG